MGPAFTPAVLWALGVGLLFAVLDWIAIIRGSKVLEYIAKPSVLAAFVLAGWLLADQIGWGWLATWFVPALVFSLLGDIFLMLPDERWFLPGLLAFLLAHLVYIVGFNPTLPPWNSLMLVPVIGMADWVVLRKLVAGVSESGAPGMRAPVIVYAMVLSVMLFSGWAAWFRPGWGWDARAAAALGATLFFVSDLMLAWNKFVRANRAMHIAVMVTYHLAQLFLTMVIGLGG